MQAAPIRLRLLGRFAMQVDGNPVTPIRIGSRKGCGLIAYLAMHPENSENRETLATLLWGNHPDQQARQNLRQCLASLRCNLAPMAPRLLVFEGEVVRLDTAALAVDAREFVTLVESPDASDLIRASALYRGEFLSGFNFNVEAFDDWSRMKRDSMASAAARAFEFCATHYDSLNDGARAIEAAERLVALDPLREDWQRLLLHVYARHRGAGAALAHGNNLIVLLKRELGVAPDSMTSTLLDEIRQGAIKRAAPLSTPNGVNDNEDDSADFRAADAAVASTREEHAGSGLTRNLPRWQLATAVVCVFVVLAGGLLLLSRTALTQNPIGASRMPPKPLANRATQMAGLSTNGIVPIAVLPFIAPMGGNDLKVADAITNDLIADLSRNARLALISRQASYYYRAHSANSNAIGAALGVRYVVEGSLRTQDSLIHVNVELVDTTTRLQVWSDQIERSDADRFSSQSEIAKRLARELNVAAITLNAHHDRKRSNPTIAELFAKAYGAHFRGPSKANILEAIENFEKALQREPRSVSALVGIAAELTRGSLHYALDPKPSLERAETLMKQALQFRPDAAFTNYWMGMVHKAQGRYESAKNSFLRVIEIDPSFAPAYAQIGMTLTLMGHANDAMHHIQYAMRLSPEDPAMRYWTMFAGVTELELGHDKAALEWFNKSAAYVPPSPKLRMFLAGAYALLGNKAAAAEQAEYLRSHADSPAVADLMKQVRLGSEGSYANTRRLRSGLELAFGTSL
ncbi:MAG TPA: BTAD domain-containing putative transcriptional regulator [Pseudolabrys sp.]|nr:BTAD domain-containing putative transcriptional regulator [Pseudolabrys sp.]